MKELICDQIAEKIGDRKDTWEWNFKAIVAYILNQEWMYPGVYELGIDKEENIVIQYGFGEPFPICSKDRLVLNLLRMCQEIDLSPKERGYILSKLPSKEQKDYDLNSSKPRNPRRRAKRGEEEVLRITYPSGFTSLHKNEDQADIEAYCRKKGFQLHKNVRGEWRQIIP